MFVSPLKGEGGSGHESCAQSDTPEATKTNRMEANRNIDDRNGSTLAQDQQLTLEAIPTCVVA